MLPAANPSSVEAEVGGALRSLITFFSLIDDRQTNERPW